MQDLMRLVYSTFVTVSLLSPAYAGSTAPRNFKEQVIEKALKDGALSVSQAELRLANNLAKIYEVTEKGYINISLTKKVLKQARNYSAFHIYKGWLQSIVKIHTQKSADSLRQVCADFAKQKSKEYLQTQLEEKSVLMCFNQYLKLLAKKPNSLDQHRKDFAFFGQHASYLTHSSNIDSLSYLLSRSDKKGAVWKKYSQILSSYFIGEGKSPSKSLLQYMRITPELTRYIQVKGLDESDAKHVLYSELKKLIKKAFKAADEGKSEKDLQKELKEVITYYGHSYAHLPKSKSDTNMLSLGKSLSRREYFSSARDVFNAMIVQNPKDENTIFEIMWTWLTQEKYSKAAKEVVQRFELDKNYKNLQDDRLQFWTAYTLRETGSDKSKEIFEDLVSKSALNYYSIIASKFLSNHYEIPSEKVYAKLANGNAIGTDKLPKLGSRAQRAIKRFKIWGSLDFKPFLNLESDNVNYLMSGQDGKTPAMDQGAKAAFILLAAGALKEKENYLESFKLIYKGLRTKLITMDETVLGILFPKPYLNQIANQSKSFDPLIALSLIRQESGFNHKARSWVGARGLMQLMPATAKMYWNGVRTEQLYNPKLNIKIGSKYLSMLLDKYEHNLVFALSAYNAGESRVKKWRKEYFTHSDSILHNIENIPFTETRKYVKLIFRNLFFYKMMDGKAEVADTNKVNQIFDVQLGFNQD